MTLSRPFGMLKQRAQRSRVRHRRTQIYARTPYFKSRQLGNQHEGFDHLPPSTPKHQSKPQDFQGSKEQGAPAAPVQQEKPGEQIQHQNVHRDVQVVLQLR